MASWFLIIIYLAFISLGLPDSLLGAAWPTMRIELGLPLSAAGLLSMLVSGGTIVSSLNSGRLIKKFGTGKLTLMSTAMTAIAILGISIAPSFIWLIVLGIPLGLGAGAIDSALNHYVADNYKAHHMNWLHSFWGVGATAGPLIMAYFIASSDSWRSGYLAVGSIQVILVIVLVLALPIWKKIAQIHGRTSEDKPLDQSKSLKKEALKHPLRIKGVKFSLLTFLFYCGVEASVGLWGASYLVESRGMAKEAAAGWIALYYGGITVGRMVTGFITLKVDNRHLILYGQILALVGSLCVLIPQGQLFAQIGLVLIGLGLAPIFPGLIHETPKRFGREHSAHLIGYQMATAYVGTTFLPPLIGLLANQLSIGILPVVVVVFISCMLFFSERIHVVLNA
jgi:fucose permease